MILVIMEFKTKGTNELIYKIEKELQKINIISRE